MLSKKKQIIFTVITVVFASLFAFIIGEIFVRATHILDAVQLTDSSGKSGFRVDADLVYSLRPNIKCKLQRQEFSTRIITNSHGYRDDEFIPAKGSDDIIITGLGDSFGFGHGVDVEDGFFDVAESILKEKNPKVRINNMAITGYCQLQHVKQLALAYELGSRVVVLAFCVHNDILENSGLTRRFVDKKGIWRAVNEKRAIGRIQVKQSKSWLYEKSHLWRFIVSRTGRLSPNLKVGGPAWYVFDQLRNDPSPKTLAAFNTTEQLLTQIHEECKRLGMTLAMVTIPNLVNASEENFKEMLRLYKLQAEGSDRRKVALFLEDFCKKRNIHFMDIIKKMEQGGKPAEEYFYRYDRHFNRSGYRFVGEALAEMLETLTENS
ncbi:MAG: hypothetical protein GY765_28135 [bacterium]|nr:hypothetical protein [bacterium]